MNLKIGKRKSKKLYSQRVKSKDDIGKKKSFDYWLRRNHYYHYRLKKFYQFHIPEGSQVLQIGCHNGYLLDAIKPSYGMGIDDDEHAIATAQQAYPHYDFRVGTIDDIPKTASFDYIILSCQTMCIDDIHHFFISLQRICHPGTRIVIDTYSYLWEPLLWIAQKLGLRRPTLFKNWVSRDDLANVLYTTNFQVITTGRFTLMPIYIPLISTICNVFAHIPLIRCLCLNEWIVARPIMPLLHTINNSTVSVIVPCKNERGTIETIVQQFPKLGLSTELIFIDGHSRDGTFEEMERVQKLYPEKNISCYIQDGRGKGDAVRKGFDRARGDIVVIHDGDNTVLPEELPKFVQALISGKGEFINGSRLVYDIEAMRFLNVLANYFFTVLLSWILNQRVKDTLCGTKMLWRSDYHRIAASRKFFGEFDPFGDFDLLFVAAKLNLKIIDVPVHYKHRQYGKPQVNHFIHGWILLYMSLIGIRKFKLY
jgi:SAM-dependent methyltransferase